MKPLTKSIIALCVALFVSIGVTIELPKIATELIIMESRLLRFFCIAVIVGMYIGLAASAYFVVKHAKGGNNG